MDRSFELRRQLLVRLLGITFVGVGAGAYGCGGTVNTPKGEGGAGGAGVSSTGSLNDTFMTTTCFAWPQSGTGGNGGMAGAGGTGGMAGAGGTGGMAGAGGSMAITCPSKAEAPMYFSPGCGDIVVETDGVFANGECCYDVIMSNCGVGRPFVVSGRVVTASKESTSNWAEGGTFQPNVDNLSAEDRALLAEAWTRDGLLEHASIASFGRFALELLAVGAPATLVEQAHKAALDEVRHARIAFELATAYAGVAIGPGAFPFAGGGIDVSHDLANVAARAVWEGCIGETLASMLAAEQALRATDPAVREALETIAEDEARHAELAWRTIAWASSCGNGAVRRTIADAFAKGLASPPVFDIVAGADGALEAHGRPAADALHAALARTLEEVIRPIATALCGERVSNSKSQPLRTSPPGL